MQQIGNSYDYVIVYTDDVYFAMKEPDKFLDILQHNYTFKLK